MYRFPAQFVYLFQPPVCAPAGFFSWLQISAYRPFSYCVLFTSAFVSYLFGHLFYQPPTSQALLQGSRLCKLWRLVIGGNFVRSAVIFFWWTDLRSRSRAACLWPHSQHGCIVVSRGRWNCWMLRSRWLEVGGEISPGCIWMWPCLMLHLQITQTSLTIKKKPHRVLCCSTIQYLKCTVY